MAFNEIAEHKARIALKRNASEQAISILMKTYGDELFRFCNSILSNRADAQDVLQTVFIQAHQGFEKFRGESNFRTWLYTISRNRCFDYLKAKRRLANRVEFVEIIPDQVSQSHSGDDNDHILSEVLRRCLSKLSTSSRTAVFLRFQSEHSYQEAATIVQEKAGTLQARVARALPLLRRCVEESGVTL